MTLLCASRSLTRLRERDTNGRYGTRPCSVRRRPSPRESAADSRSSTLPWTVRSLRSSSLRSRRSRGSHGELSPPPMGPQRPPIGDGGSSGASPLADSHRHMVRPGGMPSGPPGQASRPLKIPGEGGRPRTGPGSFRALRTPKSPSLPPGAAAPQGSDTVRNQRFLPKSDPFFRVFRRFAGGSKKAKKTPFLTPPGAESRGSGGAPPTHLILLRTQSEASLSWPALRPLPRRTSTSLLR